MKKVWMDAGHGGKDPGAVGNGLQEKDIALSLVLAIQKKFELAYEGVQVTLTRSTDIFVELADRTRGANTAGADILVSVHCNSGGGSGGFESYSYTKASATSITLQNMVHTEIIAALKPFGVMDRGKKTQNLHMVRESKMPAILTENLFIDVASDAVKLKRPEVIEALVNGHVFGIAKYLGLKKKGNEEEGGGSDILSPWAAEAWNEAVASGYFDGTRPKDAMTREEAAVVFGRLKNDLLKRMDGK